MTTTIQIRTEVEVAMRWKAIVDRLDVTQGKAFEAMVTVMEKELGLAQTEKPEGGALV